MKVLFLAPQPFFQERGTPIAVRLALEVLLKRKTTEITVLTYHEGTDVPLPGVTIKRINPFISIKNIGAGISLKKIVCDVFFLFSLFKILIQNRKEQFDVIHAVEESVFMAIVAKWVFGIPYVYDMDSSMSLQVVEKWKWAESLRPLLDWFEGLAIHQSIAVVPVCDALYEIAKRNGARDTQLLRDISLLDMHDLKESEISNVRQEAGIDTSAIIAMYIGNLETYQGIDLLVDSFQLIAKSYPSSHIVIIGGNQDHISSYKKKVKELGLASQFHLLGPKPVQHIKGYLEQADILLAPRTMGNNTPMKIYSYLHSGVATLATNLPTHTQVLTDKIAYLADANAKGYSEGLKNLLKDENLRKQIGKAAYNEAIEKYTFEVFEKDLNELYDRIAEFHSSDAKLDCNAGA